MPRSIRRREELLKIKAKRDGALARIELRGPSEPRRPASGATSAALKIIDAETERMIAEALAKKGTP